MRVRRLDLGDLRPATKRDDGTIRAQARLTRCGVFKYRLPDGSLRSELRLPEEVFDKDSLDSFSGVPVTNDHPPEMVNASNARKYAVGTLQGIPSRDEDHVIGDLAVYDADTIDDMKSRRKIQVSLGYTCDLDETPGVHPTYGKYDAVQRNIRGNHCAIVDVARAGQTACVRLDAAERADYSDDEARGSDGKWSGGAGEASAHAEAATNKAAASSSASTHTVAAQAHHAAVHAHHAASARSKSRKAANAHAKKAAVHARKATAHIKKAIRHRLSPSEQSKKYQDQDKRHGAAQDHRETRTRLGRETKVANLLAGRGPHGERLPKEQRQKAREKGRSLMRKLHVSLDSADALGTGLAHCKTCAMLQNMANAKRTDDDDAAAQGGSPKTGTPDPQDLASRSAAGETDAKPGKKKRKASDPSVGSENEVKADKAGQRGEDPDDDDPDDDDDDDDPDDDDDDLEDDDSNGGDDETPKRKRKDDKMTEEEIKLLRKERDSAIVRADAADKALAKAEGELESTKKDLDAAKAESTKMRTDAADKFDAAVDAKVALLTEARATGATVDSKMSPIEVKRAVVKHVDGIDVPAEKPEPYVDALFEGACRRARTDAADTKAGANALAAARAAATGELPAIKTDTADLIDEAAAARQASARTAEAWTKPWAAKNSKES